MASKFFPPKSNEDIEKDIEKAIKYIKIEQFHSGFIEISRPHLGGEIEVLIEADKIDANNFHVSFRFVSNKQVIIREEKIIHYEDLQRLAKLYDENKEKIDQELIHHIKLAQTPKA